MLEANAERQMKNKAADPDSTSDLEEISWDFDVNKPEIRTSEDPNKRS